MTMYSKLTQNLSQEQTIENSKAIITASYFQQYSFIPRSSRIHANIISVDSIGSNSLLHPGVSRVQDLASIIDNILTTINNQGRLYEASFTLTPSPRILANLHFNEEIYQQGIMLPLNIFIFDKERTSQQPMFTFRISNLGLSQEYYEQFPDTKRKLGFWYAELTRNLNKILPYKVRNNEPYEF